VSVSVSVSMSVGGPVSTAIKIFDETIERHIVIDTDTDTDTDTDNFAGL